MEKVKETYTLDTYAIIAYLKKEEGGEQVRALLAKAKKKDAVLYVHEINLGEVQYIIHRESGEKESDKLIAWLRECPITFVGLEDNILSQAAKIKAVYPLSFADAFAAATAISKDSVLLTGDPEFKPLEKIVKIKWLK
jgi:ribonuclease VapC